MPKEKNFYEKLSEKMPVSVLVAGDSIAYGSSSSSPEKAFAPLFAAELQTNYQSAVDLTNISVGGTDSLFSYTVVNRQAFADKFDLVVFCHGQNDAPENLERNYESLLRSVLRQNPGCEVICILESAQREYTEKLKTLKRIAGHYGCAVCDTLTAFMGSGRPYGELVCEDGVHPNDAGHRLYAEELLKTVEKGIKEHRTAAGSRELPVPLAHPFTAFRYFPRNELKRKGLELSLTACGELFCFHILEGPAGETYRIFENGKLSAERPLKHEFSWIWERMYLISGEKDTEKTLKFVLQNANDLDRIIGVSVINLA